MMRMLAGLVAAVMLAAPFHVSAQSASYELVAAPTAQRGQVVEINGVKTYTAENGWYTVTLGPDDTTDLDQDLRYFTYGKNTPGHFVEIVVATAGMKPDETVMSFDDIESGIADMISPTERPAFLDGLYISDRKIITLGDGNGHKPMQIALWIGKDPKAPDAVTVIGGTLLPKGNLMVMIDADNAEDAEAVLRAHLRIAAGVLE